MKQQRIRFKSRKKFIGQFNAQFEKVSPGVMEYHNMKPNRNKHRQVRRAKKST